MQMTTLEGFGLFLNLSKNSEKRKKFIFTSFLEVNYSLNIKAKFRAFVIINITYTCTYKSNLGNFERTLIFPI